MIDHPAATLPARSPPRPGTRPTREMTVVFDAGQNQQANFAHLAGTGLHYIGSVPTSDCPDLLALPATDAHASSTPTGSPA